MRSLRLRVFLTVWPMVVVALAVVGLQFGRWMRVEVDRIAVTPPQAGSAPAQDAWAAPRAAWARRLGAEWEGVASLLPALRAEARRVDPVATLVVFDTSGRRRAPSTAEDSLDADLTWVGGGALAVRPRMRVAGAEPVAPQNLPGTPIVSPSGTRLGELYVYSPIRAEISITRPAPPPEAATLPLRTLAADARRMIWTTVALASGVAAAVTLLLAGPIVAQVRRLAAASARLRAGALDSRVPVTTRDELGTLERAFNDMAASLELSERAKRTLISDVSHELRTPLTNVIGLLEAMRDGLREPDAAAIESAREEAALLGALVDELQELSTAEAGALHYDIEPLDAAAEAHAAVAASRPAAGPRVEPPTAAARPVRVLADRRRLAQVLRNLLRNAITHTPATGVVRVEVAQLGADRVSLTVADDGEGIPAEQLPLIWERFHRVDPSRSRATGGMGLGLAVVRQLVRGMGGEASVESAPGVGSRFTVVLPAARFDEPSSTPDP